MKLNDFSRSASEEFQNSSHVCQNLGSAEIVEVAYPCLEEGCVR